MKLFYTQRSKIDLYTAFTWYEKQKHGLGFELLDQIEVSIDTILRFPELYPLCHNTMRRCIIRRFPFSIFYSVEDMMLVVHAVFDNRQNPAKRP